MNAWIREWMTCLLLDSWKSWGIFTDAIILRTFQKMGEDLATILTYSPLLVCGCKTIDIMLVLDILTSLRLWHWRDLLKEVYYMPVTRVICFSFRHSQELLLRKWPGDWWGGKGRISVSNCSGSHCSHQWANIRGPYSIRLRGCGSLLMLSCSQPGLSTWYLPINWLQGISRVPDHWGKMHTRD